MSINPRFIQYFQENFFSTKPEEFQIFLSSLEKGIPRTIRIKPGKETDVKRRLEAYGFILTETTIASVFAIGRRDDFDPLERRIGYTHDHLIGNFYIQELAAATSVHILSDAKIHDEAFLILDMAASPGGKTTQLAEHYPNSFIIANEPTRERIPQLLQNLDRMGSANIGVTLYPGQYFRNSPEVFDRILLDAPCSGEGTLYKGTDATKHWHIKNIKTISHLQQKLLDAAIIALKVGGELLYSTCSMNLLENEGVLEYIEKKYPKKFEILFQKRFWPHIDGTGGFFVAKIRKTQSLETDISGERIPTKTSNTELKPYKSHIHGHTLKTGRALYEHTGKILVMIDHPALEYIRKEYYFMRFGEKIGSLIGGSIVFDPFVERHIDIGDIRSYEISDEEELDHYLRGASLTSREDDGYIRITYHSETLAIEKVSSGVISNHFPIDWRRK